MVVRSLAPPADLAEQDSPGQPRRRGDGSDAQGQVGALALKLRNYERSGWELCYGHEPRPWCRPWAARGAQHPQTKRWQPSLATPGPYAVVQQTSTSLVGSDPRQNKGVQCAS